MSYFTETGAEEVVQMAPDYLNKPTLLESIGTGIKNFLTPQPTPTRRPTAAEIEASRIKGEQITRAAKAKAAKAAPSMSWSDKLMRGFDIAGKMSGGAGQPGAAPSSGSPGWLMPVAIGGVALVAVVLLTKKKAP